MFFKFFFSRIRKIAVSICDSSFHNYKSLVDIWSPIRQDEKPLVKHKVFTTPIYIALVVQDVYLYNKLSKSKVNVYVSKNI